MMITKTDFSLSLSTPVVNYLKEKCVKNNLQLTHDQIEKKLMNAETFELKG